MSRRDKTKGGAPGRHPEHRPNASVAATATIAVPIVQGRLRPARGGAWTLIVQCPYCKGRHLHGVPKGAQTREERRLSHCVGGARPYRIRVGGDG